MMPWEYVCLACNWTGHAPVHACAPKAYLVDYWAYRFKNYSAATAGEAMAIFERPVARTEMARLFGERWMPGGDF
jgi:hypothetical protein